MIYSMNNIYNMDKMKYFVKQKSLRIKLLKKLYEKKLREYYRGRLYEEREIYVNSFGMIF